MNNSQGASVNFRVGGKEVEAYMETMRQKARTMANETIQNAKMQTDSSKEQIKLIKEQIRLLERKNSMERQASLINYTRARDANIAARTQASHEYIDKEFDFMSSKERAELKAESSRNIKRQEKEKYDEQIKLMRDQFREAQLQTQLMRTEIETIRRSGDQLSEDTRISNQNLSDAIEDSDDEDRADEVERENRRGTAGSQAKQREGFFKDIVTYSLLDSILGGLRTTTSARNGFDMMGGMGHVAGDVIGMVTSEAIGPAMGKLIGGLIGTGIDLTMRTAQERERVYGEMGKVRALTGQWRDVEDNSDFGFDFAESASAQVQVATGYGDAKDLGRRTTDYLALQKGYGIDPGTLAQFMEIQRGRSDADLGKMLTGFSNSRVVSDSDGTFMPQYLAQMVALQRELLQRSSNVSDSTAFSIIEMFDKVGGQWGAKDFRSSQNVSAIQSGLSNPQGDNLKALSFTALQRMNPGAGIFDILEMQEGGLNTPGYFQAMLDMVNQMGGDDQFKMMNLSGMLPGLSRSAVKELYKGYQSGTLDPSAITHKSWSLDEAGKQGTTNMLVGEASEATSDMDRWNAQVVNAFTQGTAEGMGKLASQMILAIAKGFEGVQLNVYVGPGGRTRVKPNITKSGIDLGVDQTFMDVIDQSLQHSSLPTPTETLDKVKRAILPDFMQ